MAKKKETRGRKPANRSIRANWCGPKGEVLRLSFSEDLVEHLKRAHDQAFGIMYGFGSFHAARGGYDPYKNLRMEFMRFEDIGIPGVFVRIEPPTYTPFGKRMWKETQGRRYAVEVRCAEVGVKIDLKPMACEYLFDETQPKTLGGGLMVLFPDDAMEFSGAKRRDRLEEARILRRRNEGAARL